MQKVRFHPLFTLLLITLMVFGLMMIFSASSVKSLAQTDNKSMYLFFQKQLVNNILGVAAGIVVAMYPYTKWKKWIVWMNCVTILLLVLVGFTPLGIVVNGAKRWLNLGVQFQPSELAKIVIIVTVAYLISEAKKINKLNTAKSLGKIGLYIISMGALIGVPQNHASVVMILILVSGVMLYFAGINRILFFGAVLSGIAIGALTILTSEFRRERVLTFIDPLADKMGDGYQITQNWYALGSGELFGIGLGLGRQKFGWLPENHTDFILGVIGEELGYMGVLFVILIFVFLYIFGTTIALNARDDFGVLLVMGVMLIILFQASINMAVISGLFPVTGMPLPFISYGGTSNIIMCMMMGVVYNVYSHTTNEIEKSNK
ncbi:putative peptidoglycan glycosyltransferase FtsW [Bacillus toyonensis]|uniref:FtsW/RodA/SpoVE family cell cycle protein n=1 Tax=Bacillus toyonensis TaxID=155322 RepID=UPI002E243A0A|nr:putative peptidoglycan glycosyltransferase FtsW [Bacillus toyonensis]